MNITTIKKSGITTLTIKKLAQVRQGSRSHFLANQIKNPANIGWYSYPPATDPSLILPVGTTLQVLSIHPPNTSYGPAHITVLSSTGLTFDIMATDLNRFTM